MIDRANPRAHDRRIEAARSVLQWHDLVVEEIDPAHWRVRLAGDGAIWLTYSPISTVWRRLDGSFGGYGVSSLVAALRGTAAPAATSAGLGAEPDNSV